MGRKDNEKHRERLSDVPEAWKGLLLPLHSEGTAGQRRESMTSVPPIPLHSATQQLPRATLQQSSTAVTRTSHNKTAWARTLVTG